MKFFADTAHVEDIIHLKSLGLIDGVTTNPSLIAKEGKSREKIAEEICALIEGPVSVEVIATEYEKMIEEAKELCAIADNICIKVPLTYDGLRACKTIRSMGREVNVTLCFSANQALLAARMDASFISPFIGRIDDISLDGTELIAEIQEIYDNYNFQTQILAASIRSVNHIKQAALIGADIVTAPPRVLTALIHHPLTEKGLETFLQDYTASVSK